MPVPAQFAVLLKEQSPPSAEQFKRAFSSFSNLTDADAVRLAVNTRGILQRRLNRDAARAFHHALEAQGVGAAIVAEEELPQLPDARLLHRVEISPEAFKVYDLTGRPTPVQWSNVALVAAATISRFEFGRTRTERTELRFNPVSGIWPKKAEETGHKVEWDSTQLLEIVLAGGATRYQIEATEFPFKYVIDRPELSAVEKFIWLVREICRHAPDAIQNTVARAICDGQDSVLKYESRQLLVDEMMWLLWKQAHPA